MSSTTPPETAVANKQRGTLTMSQREARLAYSLVLPTFIIVILIVILPVLWNLWLSFKPVRLGDLADGNLWSTADLTFQNFERAVGGRRFWPVLRTTFIYSTVSTILAILMGTAAALIAKDHFRGRALFRGVLLVPYIAPIVAMAFLWRLIFNAQFGIFNEFTNEVLGWQRIDYLTQRTLDVPFFGSELAFPLALTMVILFTAWRYFPFAFLFVLARLQALPEDLYEAAAVDGAAPLQRFRHITLPQLYPIITTLFLLRFIWSFNKFEDIWLLNGGVAGTEVITISIFDLLFGQFQVGRAAALATVLALILAVLLVLYFRFVIREEV